jgi:3',5'-cyclic AMP phosphodiesterase CpdA
MQPSSAKPSSKPFLIAQISDLHIKARGELSYRVVDTARHLRECIAHIKALKQQPDFVVATGDLTDFGRPEEYALLREILGDLALPLYMIPGNHDERANLRAAFPEHNYLRQGGDFIQYAIEQWPLRIVALDTVIPGESGGTLCETRLGWLAATLRARPDVPTMILMHHPPFRTLIGHMDDIGLANAAALKNVLADHAQVLAVLCGHLHRPIETVWNGILMATAPSPAHQVTLDLAPDAASCFTMEPPAYRLHAWSPEDGWLTHTAYVGKFDGPYPFYEEGGLID